MSDLVIDFRATGERRFVTEMIEGFEGSVRDLRPALLTILQDFIGDERLKFSGDGEGEWEPLSARYADRKHREFPGRRLLERTGRLEAAATGGRDLQVILNELYLKAKIVTVDKRGRNYASFVTHRRSLVTVDETSRRRWLGVIEQYLVNHAERAFGPEAS